MNKNHMEERPNTSREKGIFIIALLDRFCDVIYGALRNGLFGSMFSSYNLEQQKVEKSFVARCTLKSNFASRMFRKIRGFLSKGYEESFFLTKLRRFTQALLATSLKSYGKALLSFGIYTVLIYFIRLLVPELATAGVGTLISGIAISVCAFPLLVSDKNLVSAVGSSRFTRLIFTDVFDFREELYQTQTNRSKGISNFLILSGMLFGVFTFISNPLQILFVALCVLCSVIIVVTPEIGVITSLFSLPFLSFFESPTIVLAGIVLITAFGYVIKLIRGKRVIRFEILDILISVFMIMILFGGRFSAAEAASKQSALISCLLIVGYFLISNLMRTEKWLTRCTYAIAISGTITSIIGVLQYVFGYVDPKWLDTNYFPDIAGRSTAMFENANYLAFYLVAVFPFVLNATLNQSKNKNKLLGIISCALVVVCTVLTWSRGAWIAMLGVSILFLLIYSKKTLRIIISVLVLIPYVAILLPKNVISRVTSIGNLADSSTMYRFYTWKGSFRILEDYFWSGIGYGTEAYRAIYPEYAYAGIEAAAHSHSLLLQIFIGLGVGGALVFILAVFVFTQKNFEYFKNPFNESTKLISAAAFAAVIGLLIMGLFDYIWYNYRILFIFWAIMAISVASIRLGNREIEKKNVIIYSDMQSAALDLDI